MAVRAIYPRFGLDGACSAAIWRWAHEDCELLGLDPGESLPWGALENREVALLGFPVSSYAHLQRLLKLASYVVWIGNQAALVHSWVNAGSPFIEGLRSTLLSSCELTWIYCFQKRPVPAGVQLLGNYERGVRDERVLQYRLGLQLRDMSPETREGWNNWQEVLRGSRFAMHRTLRDGHVVRRYRQCQDAQLSRLLWFSVLLEDDSWMAVNYPYADSEFCRDLWQKYGEFYAGMLSFHFGPQRWHVSLRSDHVDCRRIARKFGGDGRRSAATFVCDELPFTLP